jgi:hypothetical protein
MSNGEKRGRDLWDRLDVLGKFTSSVLLAAIALLLKSGSDKISYSLQKGDLVRNLIADLTTQDSRTRQDIALIALNRSVGSQEEDELLVSEIAERLFLDLRGPDTAADESQSLGSIAFRVLEHRNPRRAAALREQILAVRDSITRATLRSQPDTSALAAAATPAQARLLARAFSNVIYIQYRNAADSDFAEQLRTAIAGQGFHAPGIERVEGNFRNWIRYFHAEDQPLADSIASLTRTFFAERGRPLDLKIQNLGGRGFQAQRGQIELWISS